MRVHEHTIDTDALLNDLLDPSINAIAICQRHTLTLQQLTEFLQGPLFASLSAAASALSQARTKLLALDITPKALAALLSTTQSDQESRQLNETIRKAATKLLTVARQTTQSNEQPLEQRSTPKTHPNTKTSTDCQTEPIQHQTSTASLYAQSQARSPESPRSCAGHASCSPPSAATLRAAVGSPNGCGSSPANHPP